MSHFKLENTAPKLATNPNTEKIVINTLRPWFEQKLKVDNITDEEVRFAVMKLGQAFSKPPVNKPVATPSPASKAVTPKEAKKPKEVMAIILKVSVLTTTLYEIVVEDRNKKTYTVKVPWKEKMKKEDFTVGDVVIISVEGNIPHYVKTTNRVIPKEKLNPAVPAKQGSLSKEDRFKQIGDAASRLRDEKAKRLFNFLGNDKRSSSFSKDIEKIFKDEKPPKFL